MFASGRLRRHLLGGRAGGAYRWWRRMGPGCHHVDPDAAVGVVECRDLRQTDIADFPATYAPRLAVARTAATEAMLTIASAPAGQHGRDLVLRATTQERAADVGGDTGVEAVDLDVGQRGGHRAAGRVVERPEVVRTRRASARPFPHGRRVGHVRRHGERPAAGLRELSWLRPDSSASELRAAITTVGSGLRPCVGRAGPDSAAGAGDEGDPAVELRRTSQSSPPTGRGWIITGLIISLVALALPPLCCVRRNPRCPPRSPLSSGGAGARAGRDTAARARVVTSPRLPGESHHATSGGSTTELGQQRQLSERVVEGVPVHVFDAEFGRMVEVGGDLVG